MLRCELSQLLGPIVAGRGVELWELEFANRPGGGLLRLYIDSPNGISVEDCERVSRAVSEVLDEHDPIPGEYTLEVSSPGLDRVLRTRDHFARFKGEQVRVEMREVIAGRKRFLGQLLEVGEREITLSVDGAQVNLPIDEIHKARLVPQM
jgi:ribosome maturation factor RimP